MKSGDLQRFLDAQRGTIDAALAELLAGCKRTHWMWFVFPQLVGLGRSPTAQFYAIRAIDEARDYIAHPVLAPRLRQCTQTMLSWSGRRSAEQILGSVDALKFRSSMTLFDQVAPGGIFEEALTAFYGGVPDPATLALLRAGL